MDRVSFSSSDSKAGGNDAEHEDYEDEWAGIGACDESHTDGGLEFCGVTTTIRMAQRRCKYGVQGCRKVERA